MSTLEGGTYEIIRSRLDTQKADLQNRMDQLNAARKEVFGSTETRLIANNRIITQNSCIPSDIVSIGGTFIFGYNVHFGLRTDIKTRDVFSIYSYEGGEFKQQAMELIADEVFLDDFVNLYKYYRDTTFRKFFVAGNYLYMVFQLSDRLSDIKTFKWLISERVLVYQDSRSDHEYHYPRQHDFNWVEATRDMHRYGKHPHVSINNKVFVETLGGTLTIKVEDNTATGKGIYDEEVLHPDQTLDDANYQYAELGNLIALQIKPFQEEACFFIYNHKLQEVKKIDSLSTAAIQLPDEHGLIFSNGYYLQTGEYKIFENSLKNLVFQERIASSNGEDFMYVFYEETTGQYVLMAYNLITHAVTTPIICNGFTVLDNGKLCYFRAEEAAAKNHLVQIWQTPFVKGDVMLTGRKDSLIYKIGNKDVVKAMADCNAIINLLAKTDAYAGLYADLNRQAQNLLDTYYWIAEKETYELSLPLIKIKDTANTAIDEFEKVVQLRANAVKITAEVKEKSDSLFIAIKGAPLDDIDLFVANLASLRALRGEVIGLKKIRYVDDVFITALEAEIIKQTEDVSQNCVQFLMDSKALVPYHNRVEENKKALEKVTTVTEGRKLEDEVNTITTSLEMLIDIVSSLTIDDTSKATHIINTISLIFATLNRIKADIKGKVTALGSKEARADFAAQLKLVDQSIVNALDRADTPEKADALLNRTALQLEDLEARFAAYEEFLGALLEKREEVYAVFESRKNSLSEARAQKAVAIESAAARVLKNIAAKTKGFNAVEELNGYFASDSMITKLRGMVGQLIALEDSGKAAALETQLKAIREDALRKLKDRLEMYEDGENILRLGRHRFAVNKQPLDLTIVNKKGRLTYHLTGTDFYQEITSIGLDAHKKYWHQDLVSENAEIYRGAYLAYKIFINSKPETLYNYTETDLEDIVKEETAKNYTEGYIKGVHDADAFKFLRVLVAKHHDLKLLRYAPAIRAFARFVWYGLPQESREALNAKIKASGSVLAFFPQGRDFGPVVNEIRQIVVAFLEHSKVLENAGANAGAIAQYLFEELKNKDAFTVSQRAAEVAERFTEMLDKGGVLQSFNRSIDEAADNGTALQLAIQWVSSYLSQDGEKINEQYLYEVVAVLLYRQESADALSAIEPEENITGLAGAHPTIKEGTFLFHYHDFTRFLKNYFKNDVPAFNSFREDRYMLTNQLKADLRLHEFMPKVLTSFVRNKLIDKVYLPLFGDNFAKQLGSAGEDKRTDRSGMLLLVSPPGYGKTTLMEYLASRLGLVFMKIEGPAIGHDVTSVDPLSATNTAAREELKKLNLALEMGNNVMLYLDDIQHCNPEFLQKFIALADGTRKIEGVYNGKPKTYDMKLKKFCVVMAGNPYTETGEKFRIPDMLANRADIYNLGDVIGNTAELFELSLIENAMTANSVLAQLATGTAEDLYPLVAMAQTGQRGGIELKGNHSKQDIETYVSVLDKVLKVQRVVLQVNAAYIASAAMEDAYRTEPPFKLQGSYRDMNKLIAKIEPVMNDAEVAELLLSHYKNETQTLTRQAEANLLKYKEITESLSKEEKVRWASIKEAFVKNNKLKSYGHTNEMAKLLQQITEFTNHIECIKDILRENFNKE